MKHSFLYLVALAVVFEIAGDVLFKYWSINAKSALLAGGVALYALATIVWAYSLKFELLSRAITVFTVVNLLIVVLVGVILFKESLSLTNKIGVLLGLLSVLLVQL